MKTTLFPWGFPTDNWLKDNYTFSSEYDLVETKRCLHYIETQTKKYD
jgi:hypothetical protein